jgi:hypothetical protein
MVDVVEFAAKRATDVTDGRRLRFLDALHVSSTFILDPIRQYAPRRASSASLCLARRFKAKAGHGLDAAHPRIELERLGGDMPLSGAGRSVYVGLHDRHGPARGLGALDRLILRPT